MATAGSETTNSSGKVVRMFINVGNEEYVLPENDETIYLDIPPHPYLAPSTPEKRRKYGNHQYDFKCEAKSTLKDYLKDPSKDIDSIHKILIQIGYAVQHLDQHGYTTNKKLKSERIHFSGDGTHVFLARFEAEKVNSSLEGSDLKMFGKLISDCLGKKRVRRDEVLYHLVDQIASAGISTIKAVLQHPYFWSVEKRLSFLVKVCHIGKGRDKFKKEIQNGDVIFMPVGWVKNLTIKDQDQRVESSENSYAISDLLQYAKYDEKSVFSLLRFIRNVKTHFWDDTSRNQTARNALSNDHEGLWKFFNGSFPSFFIHVYKCWKCYDKRETFIELKNMLDEMAPCRDLPSD